MCMQYLFELILITIEPTRADFLHVKIENCQPCEKNANFEFILYLVHQTIIFIQYQIFIEECLLYT